jgi:hypothetical protein
LYACRKFQSIIRGFLQRVQYRKLKEENAKLRLQELKNWAIIKIQKIVRGFIIRRTIITSLKIRQSLSKEILNLMEKYLKTGNLWRFLQEIDLNFKYMKKTMLENQMVEDDMADTFVKKVIRLRHDHYDEAWDRFGDSLNQQQILSYDPNDRG